MDTCVCCGAYVPEGRQVCFDCEREANRKYVKTDKPFDYSGTWRKYYRKHPIAFIRDVIGLKPKEA